MATKAEQALGSRAADRGRRFVERRSFWIVATQLAPFALAFAVYLAAFLIMRPNTAGDEPHYLFIAESIAYDGDVSLANDYASRERTLRVVDQFPLSPNLQARVYTKSGDLRPVHGVGLPAVLAPAVALGGLTGARIVMVFLAALLADQLFRLLRDLRLRRRYRVLGWASVVFCLPVIAFSSQIYPELPGALLVVVALRIMVAGRLSSAALALGSAAAAALVWLHVRYLSMSFAVLLGLAIAAFADDVRRSPGNERTHGLRNRMREGHAAARRVAAAARARWSTTLLPLVVPYAVGLAALAVAFQRWYGSPDPRAPYLGFGYTTVGYGGLNFIWQFALTDLLNPVAGWLPYVPVQWVGLAALGCLVVWFGWPAAACVAVAVGNELIVASAGPGVGWGFPARYVLIVIPLIAIPLALVIQEVRVARLLFFPLFAASVVFAASAVRDYSQLYPVGDKPRVFGVRSIASAFPITNTPVVTSSFTLAPGQFPPRTGRVRGDAIVAKAGRDGPGFVLWGPYGSLREGTYRATFPLAVTGVGAAAPVTTIEIAGSPTAKTFARKVVTAGELARRPKDISLEFHTPGGYFVETRVYYDGFGTLKAGAVRVEPRHVSSRTWVPDWLLVVAWFAGTILVGWLFVHLLRRRRQAARA